MQQFSVIVQPNVLGGSAILRSRNHIVNVRLCCDFNRSMQHFIRKSLRSENVFESKEWLQIKRDTKRLSMELLIGAYVG